MLVVIVRRINQILVAIAAAMLALMMFLTALDVGLRYAFNRPLAGAFELVEYMMAIMVPFSIVYCAHERGHVAVDFIMDRFPKKVRTAADIITTFITLVFIVVIAWQNVLYFFEVKGSGLTSSVLLIPTYPFIAPISIAFGTFALVLIVYLSDLFSGGQ